MSKIPATTNGATPGIYSTARIEQNYKNLSKNGKIAAVAIPALLAAASIAVGVVTKLGFIATQIGAGAAAGAALLALIAFAAVFLKTAKTSQVSLKNQVLAKAGQFGQDALHYARQNPRKLLATTAGIGTVSLAIKADIKPAALLSQLKATSASAKEAVKSAVVQKGSAAIAVLAKTGSQLIEGAKTQFNSLAARFQKQPVLESLPAEADFATELFNFGNYSEPTPTVYNYGNAADAIPGA